jgi:glucose-1-phosphate thymidylyltransferase
MSEGDERAQGSEFAEVIGLIPAAGQSRRLQPLPCSKEVLPIGFHKDAQTGQLAPKVVGHYLLEKFRAAGIRKTYIVIRDGKWDIPSYFRDGALLDICLAYVVISGSSGPLDTIDRAYPFVARNRIAFGFPDILFDPPDAYTRLIRRQEETAADVVLGLHRIADPRSWDMVETGDDGRVLRIEMKPAATELTFGWHFAVWTPAFTEFLHRFLSSEQTKHDMGRIRAAGGDAGGDLAAGTVLQAALAEGIVVHSVSFPDGAPHDIGSPENLRSAPAWSDGRKLGREFSAGALDGR